MRVDQFLILFSSFIEINAQNNVENNVAQCVYQSDSVKSDVALAACQNISSTIWLPITTADMELNLVHSASGSTQTFWIDLRYDNNGGYSCIDPANTPPAPTSDIIVKCDPVKSNGKCFYLSTTLNADDSVTVTCHNSPCTSPNNYMCENPDCRTDPAACCAPYEPPPPPETPSFHCEISEEPDSELCTAEGCPTKLSYADAKAHCESHNLELFMPRTADDVSFLMNQPYEVWIGVTSDNTTSPGRYLYSSGVPNDEATEEFLNGTFCSEPFLHNHCATIREDKGCSEDVDCSEEHYFICASLNATGTTCSYNNLGEVFKGPPTDSIPDAVPEVNTTDPAANSTDNTEDGPKVVIPTAKELPIFDTAAQIINVGTTNLTFGRSLSRAYTPFSGSCKPNNQYSDMMKHRYRGASIQFKKDDGFTPQNPMFKIFRSQCLGKSKTFGTIAKGDKYSDSKLGWQQECSINGQPVEMTMTKGRKDGWPSTTGIGRMTADQAIGEYFMPFWNFDVESAYPDEEKFAQSPGSECNPPLQSANRPGHVEPALFEIKEVYTKGNAQKMHNWWGAGYFEFQIDRNIFDAVWDLQNSLTVDDATTLCNDMRKGASKWGPQTVEEMYYIKHLAKTSNQDIWIDNTVADTAALCSATGSPMATMQVQNNDATYCADNSLPNDCKQAHPICQKYYHCDLHNAGTLVQDCGPGTVWIQSSACSGTCGWPDASNTAGCCNSAVTNCEATTTTSITTTTTWTTSTQVTTAQNQDLIYIDSSGECAYWQNKVDTPDANGDVNKNAKFLCAAPNLGWGYEQKSFTYTTGQCLHGMSVHTPWGKRVWQYSAHILDIDNNPPTFKTPCDWRAKAGCGTVYFDLSPEDADGDSVSCRWSTAYEASELAWETIDHSAEYFYWDRTRGNCTLAYDPTLDDCTGGNCGRARPLAIQVEDYSDGDYVETWYQDALLGLPFNVKSSMPLVFMAVIEEGGTDESHVLQDPNFDGLCAASSAFKTYEDAKAFCELNGGSLFSPQSSVDLNLVDASGVEVWFNALADGDLLVDQNTGNELYADATGWDASGPCGLPTESANVEKVYVSGTGTGSGVTCNVNQDLAHTKQFICTHPLLDCNSIPPSSCAISAGKMTYDDAASFCQAVGMELAMPKTQSELDWFKSFGQEIWIRGKAQAGFGLLDPFDNSNAITIDFITQCAGATTSVGSQATVSDPRTCATIKYYDASAGLDNMERCDFDKDCSTYKAKFICSKPTYTTDMACYNKPAQDPDCEVLPDLPVEDIPAMLAPGREIFAPKTEEDLEFLQGLEDTDEILLGIRVASKGKMYYNDGSKVSKKLEPCSLDKKSSEEGLLLYDIPNQSCSIIPEADAPRQKYIQRPLEGCSAFAGGGCTIGAAWIPPSPGVSDAIEIELNEEGTAPLNPILIPWKGVLTYDGKYFSRIRSARWTTKPYNMICPNIDGDGGAICTWDPEIEQFDQSHELCGICEPAIQGSQSREHCLQITFKPSEPKIPDICAFQRENLYRDITWSGEGVFDQFPPVSAADLWNHEAPDSAWFEYQASLETSLSPETRVDVQMKILGDYNISDLNNLFDNDENTVFTFDEPCGEDYVNELQFRVIKPEADIDVTWEADFDLVIFEKIVIKLDYDYVSLPRFDSSHADNSRANSNGFSPDIIKGYYYVLEADGVNYTENVISSLIPTDDIFTFEIRLAEGAIVANKFTLKFAHADIRVSELKIHWKECVHIPYLSGNFRPGQVIVPGIDREICAVDAKPSSLSVFGYEIVLNGDTLQPGYYNIETEEHEVKQFTWSAIKKSSGFFTTFAAARAACQVDGKELIYPFIQNQEEYWRRVVASVEAVSEPDSVYALIGLTHTHTTTTTGKFYPPGQLKALSPGEEKNGYTNFWGSTAAAAASAAFVEFTFGNAFYLPSQENAGWQWLDMTNPPPAWNTIICMGIGEKITNCKNLDDCVPTAPEESECICPNGEPADPDPDNDPTTSDLETCPPYDACTELGKCRGPCTNEYKAPFFRCGCPEEYAGVRYQLGYDGLRCYDINECELGTHLCDETTECKNLDGVTSDGYECICKRTGAVVSEKTDGFFSCLECPCSTCAFPDPLSGFCASYADCSTPINLKTDLNGLTCPGGFNCEDYKDLKCPISKTCSHVSECVFDCKRIGTGWFCPLEKCLEKQDCEFACIDDTKCASQIMAANGKCVKQSECCLECGKNFADAGMDKHFLMFLIFMLHFFLERTFLAIFYCNKHFYC